LRALSVTAFRGERPFDLSCTHGLKSAPHRWKLRCDATAVSEGSVPLRSVRGKVGVTAQRSFCRLRGHSAQKPPCFSSGDRQD
jgi:hypothetical protein